MIDLLVIMIPAMLITLGAGLWCVKDFREGSKGVGKAFVVVLALCVAGLITIAYVGGIVSIVMFLGVIGYLLYKRRSTS